MKVMCINDKWENTATREPCGGMQYGEIATVVGECTRFSRSYYEFSEYPGEAYDKKNFIPLSEIDETELVNQRENVNA